MDGVMDWKGMIVKIWHDQSGATAIEYGLIAALICIAMIVALQGVADTTNRMWEDVRIRVVAAIGS